MFSLNVFGGITLFDEAGPVRGAAAQRRRLALLALLAAAPPGGISREKLTGYLWAESSSEQARRFLADSIYALRRALGPAAIDAVGDNLRLDPGVVRCDFVAFRNALAANDAAAAIAVYQGPFLDGFFVPGAAEFEQWAEAERERAARDFAAALETVAGEHEAAGDFANAVETWRRLTAHEPFSSRRALRLMRALDAAGDPAGALRHARVHEQLLRQELNVEPDAGIAAFTAALRSRLQTASATGFAGIAGKEGTDREELDERNGAASAELASIGSPASPAGPATPAAKPLAAAAAGEPPPARPNLQPRFPLRAAAAGLVALMLAAAALAGPGRTTQDRAGQPDRPDAGGSLTAGERLHPSSIAVLPFVDVSPERDHEHFSDGITDELIGALARVDGLRVVARTSAFSFKGAGVPVADVAHALNVRHVLEGSVRRSGDRLRISAQLIDAETGFPTWSQVYDRQLDEIFAIQQEIAHAIVAALRVRLGPSQAALRWAAPPEFESYEQYLRGMYILMNGASRDALPRAISHLERAVGDSPGFAAAHAALAEAYSLQALFGAAPAGQAVARARSAARTALALDSTRAEPWTAHASFLWIYDYEWAEAERHLRRAITLDPSYTPARLALALCLQAQGRFEEALAEAHAARAADPLAPAVSTILGRIHVNAGRPDKAIQHLNDALQLNPQLDIAYQQLGHAYMLKQMHDQAIAALRTATELSGGRDVAHLAWAHAASGDRAAATALLEELGARDPAGFVEPVGMAMIFAALGNADEAFRWLERGYATRAPFMHAVRVTPAFTPLRTDVRWRALLEKMRNAD